MMFSWMNHERWDLRAVFAAAVVACGILSPDPACADQPKERPTVRFGMSTVISGPSARLGLNMRAGVLAAFEEANRDSQSRWNVELDVRDDGYEPSRTGKEARSLIEEAKVLAMVGNVGTPTAVVALPICRESGTPFVGAFTGAAFLRPEAPKAPESLVFNLRAGYSEEVAEMITALIENAGVDPRDIGFFTQRDAFGDAGYQCGLNAFKAQGIDASFKPLHVRYERNTMAVENAVADCLMAERRPRAIVMVGTYAPCAAFVRLATESGYTPRYLCVSFIGAEALAKELGDAGNGVVVTQVVPTLDSQAPILTRFRDALSKLPEAVRVEPSLGSLEGYAVGRMVLMALDGCAEPPTRDSLAKALEGLGTFDLGLGSPTSITPKDHQASHRVWPSVIRDGGVQAFEWKSLTAPMMVAGVQPEGRP